MSVFQPVDIRPFIIRARSFVSELQSVIPLLSVVLDNWNSQEGQKTVRLIYAGPFTETCGSQCDSCPLFRYVGIDKVDKEPDFAVTLCEAIESHNQLLGPSSQRFLNCKTIGQYQDAFVKYVVNECLTQEKMFAELLWISGFKIIFLFGFENQEELVKEEERLKKQIVAEILRKLFEIGDSQRTEWIKKWLREK